MTILSSSERERRQYFAELSRKEAEQLAEKTLYCPNCGYKIGVVYSDLSGHMTAKCQKCKTISVLNLAYFRRQRRRWRKRQFPF